MVNIAPAHLLRSWRCVWLAALLLLILSSCGTRTPDPFFTPTPNGTATVFAAATATARLEALAYQPVPVTAATGTEIPTRVALLTSTPETVHTRTPEDATAANGTSSPTAPDATPTAPPPAPPEPSRTLLPTSPLPFWGTWGLMPSRDGLWAMRPDGTNMTLLTNDPIYYMSTSPTGRMVAYVTHPNPDNFYYENPFGYTLKIITLPEGRIFDITTLDMFGVTIDSPYEDLDRAVQAISVFENGGLEWSPGGLRLAFSSAHESASAELYVYTPSVGKLDRLTSGDFPNGPAHSYGLRFSPDGARIFHARAYHFGTGAGFWMAGAWITKLDGTSIQVGDDLYAGERVIDWPRNDAVILSSWADDCGDQNLRMVNVINGEANVFWPHCYEDYVYDRRRGEIVISVSEEMAAFQEGSAPGFYIYYTWNKAGERLTEMGFNDLYRGDFYAGWYGFRPGEGLFSITRTGQVSPLMTGAPYDGSTNLRIEPYFHASNDPTWLWSGDGFYAAQPGTDPRLIANTRPQTFNQAPNRNDLYYFTVIEETGPRIYGLRRGEWVPFEIDSQVSPSSIDWIN